MWEMWQLIKLFDWKFKWRKIYTQNIDLYDWLLNMNMQPHTQTYSINGITIVTIQMEYQLQNIQIYIFGY